MYTILNGDFNQSKKCSSLDILIPHLWLNIECMSNHQPAEINEET